MNREQLEGKWDQVKGLVKEKWGKLTDDDLLAISGKSDRLKGKIRERYGYSKDRIEQEMEDFLSEHDENDSQEQSYRRRFNSDL